MQWLIVNEADNMVIGWQRTPASEPPQAPNGQFFCVCNDEEFQQYFDLQAQAYNQNREPKIFLNNEVLTLAEDTRDYFSISSDKTDVIANNVDTVIMTFRCLNTDTIFTGFKKIDILGKLYKLNFINGVASCSYKFSQSGKYVIQSNNNYKVQTPLVIEAFEE